MPRSGLAVSEDRYRSILASWSGLFFSGCRGLCAAINLHSLNSAEVDECETCTVRRQVPNAARTGPHARHRRRQARGGSLSDNIGGPGRTRTRDPTVMSGLFQRGKPRKIRLSPSISPNRVECSFNGLDEVACRLRTGHWRVRRSPRPTLRPETYSFICVVEFACLAVAV